MPYFHERRFSPNIQRLADVGFELVDQWRLVVPTRSIRGWTRNSGGIGADVPQSPLNAVYAFAVDKVVTYIGVTDQGLARRFTGYENPGPNSTGSRICATIKAVIQNEMSVQIFAWFDKEKTAIGEFALDRCYSFEKALIAELDPPWNKLGRRQG
jgi:hypothetical protein